MYKAILLFLAVQGCTAPKQSDETDILNPKLADIHVRKELAHYVNRVPPSDTKHKRGRGATLKRPITLNLQDSVSPSNIRESYHLIKHSELSGRSANKKPAGSFRTRQSTTNNPLVTKKTNFSRSIIKKNNIRYIQPQSRNATRQVALERKYDNRNTKEPNGKANTPFLSSKRNRRWKVIKNGATSPETTTKRPVIGFVKKIYYYLRPKKNLQRNTSFPVTLERKYDNRNTKAPNGKTNTPSLLSKRNRRWKTIKNGPTSTETATKRPVVGFVKKIYYYLRPKKNLPSNTSIGKIPRSHGSGRNKSFRRRGILRSNKKTTRRGFYTLLETIKAAKDFEVSTIDSMQWKAKPLRQFKDYIAGFKLGECDYLFNVLLEEAGIMVYEADLMTGRAQASKLWEILDLEHEHNESCFLAEKYYENKSPN